MRTSKYTDEQDLIKKATEILIRELGSVDAIRFITIPHHKRIESVKRHRKWQEGLEKNSFFDEVFV